MCQQGNEASVKWNSSDGFKCALVLVSLSLLTNDFIRLVYSNCPAIAAWLRANAKGAEYVLLLIHSSLWLLTAFVLARVRSPNAAFRLVGLSNKPTLSGWLIAWLAICIGLLAMYGVSKQWIPANSFTRGFHYKGGITKWLFVLYAVLIAPFSEEIVMRGCLYKAFRARHSIYTSTILVLCVHSYFHWGIIAHSFYTFTCLLLVEILLCSVREWTDSIWNCVVCHSAYNATQNLPWYVFSIGLMIYLVFLCQTACKKPQLH